MNTDRNIDGILALTQAADSSDREDLEAVEYRHKIVVWASVNLEIIRMKH
jgi:hypothetical protein